VLRNTFQALFRRICKIAKSDCKLRHVCPHGTTRLTLGGFSWNFIFDYFSKNLSGESKFHQNRTGTAGTLHEDQHTFFIVSRSFLLRMKNVSHKGVQKLETHILWSITFFPPKTVPFMEKCGKFCRAGQATEDNMAHAYCMLDNWGYK